MRMEPPPSPPIAAGTRAAATPTAVPPLDPPADIMVSHGFLVRPLAVDSVNGHCPNSGMVVLPTMTAPAARNRLTTALSATIAVEFARPPKVVTWPATSSSSLIAKGTPCSGPFAIKEELDVAGQ